MVLMRISIYSLYQFIPHHFPFSHRFIEAEKVEKEKHKYGRLGHALGQAQFQAQNEIDKLKKKVHHFTH